MKAARYHSFGDPSVLVVEEAPEPHAVAGTVRIRVEAVSVNPIDCILRSGALQQALPLDLPAIPGRDAVGVVDEVGPDVTDTRTGDRVFGLGGLSDTTAEFAVLSAWSAVPAAWSVPQAAAAGLASDTAGAAIESLGDLAGRTLLIEGAAGAVGTAAVAMALAAGARVIGTAREAKQPYVRQMGAAATAYGPGLAGRVSAFAPDGVDVAIHAAPSPSLGDLVTIVGDPRRVVTVIDSAGAAELGTQHVNARNESSFLRRSAVLGDEGRYLPRVDHTLPIDDIVEAHRLAEGGGGKVVVTLHRADGSAGRPNR